MCKGITINDRAPSRLRIAISDLSISAGSFIFKPVSSAIGTALLPVTVPSSYVLLRKVVNHPDASAEVKNPFVQRFLPSVIAGRMTLRTPIGATVGFELLPGYQKYQQK